MKIFCFAHAGAGVSAFGRWPATLGPDIERIPILLPGRDTRRRERRVTDRRTLLLDLLRTVGPPPRGPYVLYGHSLGGLIAYTVTRALEDAGLNPPALVAVGACPPPDATAAILHNAHLPDEELVRLLGGFGSMPPRSVIPGGLWERTALPVLRDDLRLARSLRDAADKPLHTALLVVSGRDDALVTSRTMSEWRHWASGPVVQRTLSGDHFFLRGRDLPRLLGRACRVVRRTTECTPGARPTASDRTALEKIGS